MGLRRMLGEEGRFLVKRGTVTPDQGASLERQVQALYQENQQLRAELEAMRERARQVSDARAKALLGGGRLLIPLLDRNKVVRSFASFAETISGFAGPSDQWPHRDKVLTDARTFMESCVRFVIRRRTWLALFSIIAAAIPAIQVWLVVQQNEIIENQNEFSEIQVYDIVSRSMTEGDRNARLMTGALLSRADLDFLRGVVEEAFVFQGGMYQGEALDAGLRLEDAAFRGHLIRAVVRAVEVRGGEMDSDELFERARPMLDRILEDAVDRVPVLLRLENTASGESSSSNAAATMEQVDYYLAQVVEAMRVYGRLAREAGEQEAYWDALAPVFARITGRSVGDHHFEKTLGRALEALMFELALAPGLSEPVVDEGALQQAGLSVEEARSKGVGVLQEQLGDAKVRFENLVRLMEASR